jgi:hypothetical protein
MLAAQEKDRVVSLNVGLDRALNLFTVRAVCNSSHALFIGDQTTCVLSSNECVLSSNELVRSNTIQLDTVASTLKQLDGEMSEMSQDFAVSHNLAAISPVTDYGY